MSLWFRRVGKHSSQLTIVHVSITRVTGQIPSRKYLSLRSALSSISPRVDCWILCELHGQKRHPRVNAGLFLCFRSSIDFFVVVVVSSSFRGRKRNPNSRLSYLYLHRIHLLFLLGGKGGGSSVREILRDTRVCSLSL